MESGRRYYVQSPFRFRKAGQCGADMAENGSTWPSCRRDLLLRGCQVDSVNHPTAMYQMNCGNPLRRRPGDRRLGDLWVGFENQNLPGFIVLPEVSTRKAGRRTGATASCRPFPRNAAATPRAPRFSTCNRLRASRRNINARISICWPELNQAARRAAPEHDELAHGGRLTNWPFACRCRSRACSTSPARTQHAGAVRLGRRGDRRIRPQMPAGSQAGRKGVRFVQLYNGSWDSHDYIERAHGNLIRRVDQPIAALLSISNSAAAGQHAGRLVRRVRPHAGQRRPRRHGVRSRPQSQCHDDLAGRRRRQGRHTIGATDELGMTAVEHVASRARLPRHAAAPAGPGRQPTDLLPRGGRFKQLSQFGGFAGHGDSQ
jgi:hypothetical protein